MNRRNHPDRSVSALSDAFAVAVAVVVVVVVGSGTGCAPVGVASRRDHPLLSREVGGGPSSSPSGSAPGGLLGGRSDDRQLDDDDAARAVRLRLAAAAAAVVGSKAIVVGGVRYRFDCSGVASGIYAKAGLPLEARASAVDPAGGSYDAASGGLDVRGLYELVRRTGSLRLSDPLPGDFVFFDDTWDQNGNGRVDDPLSHVGVVEHIEDDGTVVFVHRIGRHIVRNRLNLNQPTVRHDDKGRALNHYLRAARGNRPARTTGELFVGYGSLPVTAGDRLVATRD